MNKALSYAEDKLGVHAVYEEAERILEQMDEALMMLDSKIDIRRRLDSQIEDRHMLLLIEERGKAADISQAAMDRRLKEVYHKDEKLRELRVMRDTAASEVSGLELDIEHFKYRLKVKVGRMHELGGYFEYLAAVKQAETSTSGSYVLSSAVAGGEANATNEAGDTK